MPSAQPPSLVRGPTKGTVTCESPAYPRPGGPPALAKTIAMNQQSALIAESGLAVELTASILKRPSSKHRVQKQHFG